MEKSSYIIYLHTRAILPAFLLSRQIYMVLESLPLLTSWSSWNSTTIPPPHKEVRLLSRCLLAEIESILSSCFKNVTSKVITTNKLETKNYIFHLVLSLQREILYLFVYQNRVSKMPYIFYIQYGDTSNTTIGHALAPFHTIQLYIFEAFSC